MNTIKETKKAVLESLKQELKEIETEEEIYFHDIIHNEVDCNTPVYKNDCFRLLSETDTDLNFIDKGVLDFSDLNRLFITLSYEVIHQELFNDDFIQYLQQELNNEVINKKKAIEIIYKIEKEQKREGFKRVIYEDNENQIFLRTPFNVSVEDFKTYVDKGVLKKEQLINLSDAVKILTSNKSLNQNALVIEDKKRDFEKGNYLLRVYLMEKDKDLDIRNLFKLESISEETGFNLSPSAYIEQTTEQYEKDKPFKKNYLSEFKSKSQFIKHIVKTANKLTERTI